MSARSAATDPFSGPRIASTRVRIKIAVFLPVWTISILVFLASELVYLTIDHHSTHESFKTWVSKCCWGSLCVHLTDSTLALIAELLLLLSSIKNLVQMASIMKVITPLIWLFRSIATWTFSSHSISHALSSRWHLYWYERKYNFWFQIIEAKLLFWIWSVTF